MSAYIFNPLKWPFNPNPWFKSSQISKQLLHKPTLILFGFGSLNWVLDSWEKHPLSSSMPEQSPIQLPLDLEVDHVIGTINWCKVAWDFLPLCLITHMAVASSQSILLAKNFSVSSLGHRRNVRMWEAHQNKNSASDLWEREPVCVFDWHERFPFSRPEMVQISNHGLCLDQDEGYVWCVIVGLFMQIYLTIGTSGPVKF